MKRKIDVFYEATPNPQAMKFLFIENLTQESVFFENAENSFRSPLAQKIFGFPWASSIHIGPNYITVTKQEWVEWKILADPLCDLIKEHLENGQPLILEKTENTSDEELDRDPTIQKIKLLLNTEIRPAVALDGGDIQFHSFNEGTLYIRMVGACSGCPSSMITLKEGIETRFKELIPEVKEVLALD